MRTSNVNNGDTPVPAGCNTALPALACEARELKRIMANLAEQFVEADRRHSEALAKVQAKLGLLGDTTHGLRQQLPEEMSGVLDRIEDRMAKISNQISGPSSDGAEAARPSQAAVIAAAVAAAPVAPAAPALRSALSSDARDAYDRGSLRRRSGGQAPIDNFDVVDSGGDSAETPIWDQGAVDELARLYEADASRDGAAPALDAVSASAETVAQHSILAAQAVSGSIANESERAWLEQRFAEVAAKLEHSLEGLSSSGSLGVIETRFSALEQRITEVMGDAVKRTDLESLKSIETQVEDLNAQLYNVQSHFSRLDTIELELRALSERLSTDTFSKALDNDKGAARDSEALAGAVANRVVQQMPRIDDALQAIASQLSSQKIAALVAEAKGPTQDPGSLARLVAEYVAQSMPATGGAHSDPIARIEELKSMLESFASERRHGDEQTSTMLDTMQQAMIRLLDRMDAIEHSQYATGHAPLADDPDYGEPHRAQQGDSLHAGADQFVREAPREMAKPYDEPVPTSAHVANAPVRPAPQPMQPELTLRPMREMPRPQMPDPEPEPTLVQNHAAGGREDFIAAARRAARMAAEAPTQEQPALDSPIAPSASAGKRKEKTGKRQISPVSMILIAAVLVGASFLAVKSTILAPRAAAPGAAAPATAKSAPVKQAPNLEDADTPADGRGAQPGRPQRSSLPGQGGNGDGGFPSGLPPEVQQQVAGTLPLPAAFTRDELPAASAPRSAAMPPVTIGPTSLRNAAAKGDPAAEFEIGARFAEGRGVPQDLQQAVAWYQRAAAQGFAPAQYRLASMFERGLGVKADLARARVWYQRAAEGGVVKAMHNMAVLSAGRDSSLTDYQSAAKWFTAAAEHGLTDSQFNLAIMLDSGLGLERDPKQAYKWFSVAARAGDDEAARRRDALRSKLSAQDVAAIESQVAVWRPKSADKALNDPRLAGEGWKSRTQ
jgi:localization factor PodJL